MVSPIISIENTKSLEGKLIIFTDSEVTEIPAKKYYALVGNSENIAGIFYSDTNGFSSSYTKQKMRIKQFCKGGRPCVLYN